MLITRYIHEMLYEHGYVKALVDLNHEDQRCAAEQVYARMLGWE